MRNRVFWWAFNWSDFFANLSFEKRAIEFCVLYTALPILIYTVLLMFSLTCSCLFCTAFYCRCVEEPPTQKHILPIFPNFPFAKLIFVFWIFQQKLPILDDEKSQNWQHSAHLCRTKTLNTLCRRLKNRFSPFFVFKNCSFLFHCPRSVFFGRCCLKKKRSNLKKKFYRKRANLLRLVYRMLPSRTRTFFLFLLVSVN